MRKRLYAAAPMPSSCSPAFTGEIPTPPAPQPQGPAAHGPTAGDRAAAGAHV